VAAPLSEIMSVVREILHDNDVEIAATTQFDDLIGWDSMDLITVVVEIECRLDLQFELPEIDRLMTIGDLVHLITAKQALVAA
jgi:acyl carrier protein